MMHPRLHPLVLATAVAGFWLMPPATALAQVVEGTISLNLAG